MRGVGLDGVCMYVCMEWGGVEGSMWLVRMCGVIPGLRGGRDGGGLDKIW